MNYALITGGTSGIGYELARCFLSDKYKVIIVSSSMPRLLESKQKLDKEFPSNPVLIYEQDLSQIGAANNLYAKLKADNIDVEVLVNNAGFGLIGSSEMIDLKKDEKMMILNIINLTELSKLYLADMYSFGRGKILNVSSIGAFQPGPYTSTYFASKSFVLSYSRAIRYEAKAKGVQVSTLCPGATKSEFFEREGVKTPAIAMDSQKVAQEGYKGLMNNKGVIVPGLANKLFRLIPEWIRVKSIANSKFKSASRRRNSSQEG